MMRRRDGWSKQQRYCEGFGVSQGEPEWVGSTTGAPWSREVLVWPAREGTAVRVGIRTGGAENENRKLGASILEDQEGRGDKAESATLGTGGCRGGSADRAEQSSAGRRETANCACAWDPSVSQPGGGMCVKVCALTCLEQELA